jgi:hypothetical protein
VGKRYHTLDEHGLQIGARVVQGSGQPGRAAGIVLRPPLPSQVSGHEEE